MEKELTVTQPTPLIPQEVVENATTQAKLLMDIVEKTQCFQIISNKKYLQVEAWETIGAFNRINAQTENMEPIIKDAEIIGYRATVQLWRGGEVVGGAIMPCYFTENCCKGKEGDAKHKAAMSAAQTFATSKAYRMNFSYVAILAGYEPTPAEEMEGETKTRKKEHWCAEHNCAFDKKSRGGSTWYAHKLSDGSWCNEAKKKDDTPKDAQQEMLEKPNLGALFSACHSRWGMSQGDVLDALHITDKSQIADPQEAYERILAIKET